MSGRPPRDAAQDVDPLFVVGIPVAGAGAALLATVGPVALGLIGVGVAIMIIGALRTGHGPG